MAKKLMVLALILISSFTMIAASAHAATPAQADKSTTVHVDGTPADTTTTSDDEEEGDMGGDEGEEIADE
jgi:hypothetical protein